MFCIAALVLAVTGLSFINLVINGSSLTGALGLFNNIQMIMLIPMIGSAMPSEVIVFISKLGVSLLDLSIIFGDSDSSITSLTGLDYPQTYWYYTLIEIESGSALVNLQMSLLSVFSFIPLTIIIC